MKGKWAWLRDVCVVTKVRRNRAAYAREKLDTDNVSAFRKYCNAREFKGLSKEAFRASKVQPLVPLQSVAVLTII